MIITKKQLQGMYLKMLKANSKPVPPNRVNCYTCGSCKHITKTIDVDHGVIPFMHSCEKCNGTATSSFFRDIAPLLKPTQEWYRPSFKQVWNLYKKQQHDMVEHIMKGGLDVRKIQNPVRHG